MTTARTQLALSASLEERRYDAARVSATRAVTAAIEVEWIDLNPDEDALRSLQSLLTDAERARVARRATPALRRRATVSLAARRLLVADVLGVSAARVELIVLDDGRRGATAADRETVAVSVSTSGDTGLVAVSASCVVGVDVDDFGELPQTSAFSDRVATPEEQAAIAALPGQARARALLALWTRKEAYLKATGEGIDAGFVHVAVPLEADVWGRRFHPTEGCAWYLYDLDGPRQALAAALVARHADGDGDVAPEVRVRPSLPPRRVT